MFVRVLTFVAALSAAVVISGCRETDHNNFVGGPASTTQTLKAALTSQSDQLVAHANAQKGTGGPQSATGGVLWPDGHVEDIAGDAGKGAHGHGHDHGDHGKAPGGHDDHGKAPAGKEKPKAAPGHDAHGHLEPFFHVFVRSIVWHPASARTTKTKPC